MSLVRAVVNWKLRSRSLELGKRTLVMGVVNLTPDSFSDGGNFLDPDGAVRRGLELLEQGAAVLDLGAESTRPGALVGLAEARVSAEEEQARLLPVIEGIRKARPEAVISADTYKSATAKAAIEAGAEIVNDVSGFTWDPEMARVCADAKCGVVLMHTRGRPDEWRAQEKLPADASMASVRSGLAESLQQAIARGVAPASIVLDPGYGFGKKFEENYALLARQAELLELGRPLLAGVSRKSFLGHTLAGLFGGKQAPVDARETASIAAMVATILHGASLVRVHDVRAAVEAARIADAVLAAS
ncbi:dihydropteroate synthase [Occallatibacter savannae]|uniref:dihydropteroate synthase n=1 Tax=Occallatibacter savannae TaxID=1002691 RepID=UPI001EF43E95|nr:dihydropteroate synthase [Occallatibacter savannae]